MRFQVNRDVFSEAVSFVVKLLPQRNPQPILAGVLIEADGSGLTLSAFDYEASARTTIEATVETPARSWSTDDSCPTSPAVFRTHPSRSPSRTTAGSR